MSRTIYGMVDANGEIQAGSGYRVNHTKDSGIYDINFEPPFNRPPGGAGTLIWPGNDPTSKGGKTTANVIFIYLDNNLLRLKTGDSDGNAKDKEFTFTITGE